jgi:transcription antitermination protein NusB
MGDSSRHHAREMVLQAIYAAEVGDADPFENLERLIDAATLTAKHADFARVLLGEVLKYSSDADRITEALAEHWELERIATIDRLILRLALTELKALVDVPVKVVLNEAIELAKTFSTAQSSAFVNGILDQYVRQSEGKTERAD